MFSWCLVRMGVWVYHVVVGFFQLFINRMSQNITWHIDRIINGTTHITSNHCILRSCLTSRQNNLILNRNVNGVFSERFADFSSSSIQHSTKSNICWVHRANWIMKPVSNASVKSYVIFVVHLLFFFSSVWSRMFGCFIVWLPGRRMRMVFLFLVLCATQFQRSPPHDTWRQKKRSDTDPDAISFNGLNNANV